MLFIHFFDCIALTGGGDHIHFEGNSIFFAIAVHKFPEGLALASLMVGASYPTKKIIAYVFLVELTTLLGGIAGIILINYNISSFWFGILMAHVAGGFIFLAFHAVLGEMLKNHTKLVLVSFFSGALLILLTRIIVAYF